MKVARGFDLDVGNALSARILLQPQYGIGAVQARHSHRVEEGLQEDGGMGQRPADAIGDVVLMVA
jgi:hypothetical protein